MPKRKKVDNLIKIKKKVLFHSFSKIDFISFCNTLTNYT